MDGRSRREWIPILGCTLLLGGAALLGAQLLIRNLSVFLHADPQFQAIFAQLQDAKLVSPIWLLLPQTGICFLAWRLWKEDRKAGGLCFLLFGGIVILFCALYCTRVNGILFGDVMRSLLEVLMKGGLEL